MIHSSPESCADEIVATINEIAKANAQSGAQLGYVLSVNPLRIATDNLILAENDLWADAFLLSGYTRSTEGTTAIENASGELSFDKMAGDFLVHLNHEDEEEG